MSGAEGRLRVLRVYHGGRDPAHRTRDRELAAAGLDVTVVVPATWPDGGAEATLSAEPFRVVELAVDRPGDVNRHRYRDGADISRLLAEIRPDVLDLHEEPVSLAARQWLHAAAPDVPVAMYTAQNVDKRFPPPYAQFEAKALGRVDALYPCSRQAASVARGKGFTGLIEVLPLGSHRACAPGPQSLSDPEIHLGVIGRLEPEKGVQDAVRVLADLLEVRRARLFIVGQGPEEGPARSLAAELGVEEAVDFLPWQSAEQLAALYRDLHVVLVPSRGTETWVEQFGRIIVEAQASGAVVVGYASGAIPEVGSSATVLVPESDLMGLSTALLAVVTSPDEYQRLRTEGLRRAPAYSWAQIAQQQKKLYERMLAAPSPRDAPLKDRRDRRRKAVDEFGPTASLQGGRQRPFALPVLRKDTAMTRLLARTVDATSAIRPR